MSRVDLDARRIEFRLVQGLKFESLMRDPGSAKLNGKAGNRRSASKAAVPTLLKCSRPRKMRVKLCLSCHPKRLPTTRGVNKRRAADESRSKAAAREKAGVQG
ncbi:hypothetical protein [Mycobacterium tuberculosis]|uniref:hypothetical protein n=1 Tax=Mycobacterium tuberculosis TaxID=1773 RepID=UPI002729FDA3|nr:hypothetical protein [Mycobacterium tuberculosis]